MEVKAPPKVDLNDKKVINFWCDKCRIDLKLEAHQRIKNRYMGLCWSARCPRCEREVVRLINNAAKDPYFRLSEKVRSDRRRYAKDIIQIDHPDFDKLYPNIRKEREEKQEKLEREAWDKENKKDSWHKRKLTL